MGSQHLMLVLQPMLAEGLVVEAFQSCSRRIFVRALLVVEVSPPASFSPAQGPDVQMGAPSCALSK
jgi:hypothetical protein